MNEKDYPRDGFFSFVKRLSYENKIKLIMGAVAIFLMIFAVSFKTRALEVELKGKTLGVVRKEADVERVLEDLKKELKEVYDMDIVLNEKLNLKKVHVTNKNITDSKKLKDQIKSEMTFLVEGYTLTIEDRAVASLKTEKEINQALEEIKKPYIEKEIENEKSRDVTLLEDIKIKKEKLPVYKIIDKEKLINKITTGGEEIKTHTVEVGESLWTIAKIYGTTIDDIIAANKDGNPEDLKIGDEIKLVQAKPLLTVATISEIEYEEDIDYETEVKDNAQMYTNERQTKVKGEKGKSKIVAKEVRHNGQVVEKEVLKEAVVKEPVKEVVMKGTKEKPKTAPTGSFLMPTRGRISSRYGMRNGRMHRGLDIAAGIGTPINAADGGRVIRAGFTGSYGNLVEIDHGNGYRTKYAHCSKILVSPGQRVHKGQHIANIGNTGRSTGPHLHVEVLKNGSNRNPIEYLR